MQPDQHRQLTWRFDDLEHRLRQSEQERNERDEEIDDSLTRLYEHTGRLTEQVNRLTAALVHLGGRDDRGDWWREGKEGPDSD